VRGVALSRHGSNVASLIEARCHLAYPVLVITRRNLPIHHLCAYTAFATQCLGTVLLNTMFMLHHHLAPFNPPSLCACRHHPVRHPQDERHP
jgi:hypothetical protein